jgi:ubiquinone/menaquinone biosynthesis C-methylase UbiE
MSKFNPDYYRQYRPYYPLQLFEQLPELLKQRGGRAPFRIADIGCGTGHSTLSLVRACAEWLAIGVDPDPEMLDRAREMASGNANSIDFKEGSGERTGLPELSVDAITVGSAFHWMDGQKAREEFERLLRPGGILLVYEYQFPKCAALPELNEWIRREFNLRWKAPQQKPRGDFYQVTSCFRESQTWRHLNDRKVPMIQLLNPADLSGLIFSQSRVLHYENELSRQERELFHENVNSEVYKLMKGISAPFDFNLSAATFERIVLS